MTHIEQIKDAIRQKQQEVWPTDTGEMAPATVPNNLEQGWLNALSWMEKFINSIAPEQQSEDLEKKIDRVIKEVVTPETLQDYIMGFKAGAKWQREQMMKSAFGGEITRFFNGNLNVKAPLPKDTKCCFGDKVKVIIIKEDEQ